MFFRVNKRSLITDDFLKTDMYLNACFLIENYPIRASEKSLDLFIKQNYKISLKEMCFKLLTQLSVNEVAPGELVLVFNDLEQDAIARLITYGNGVVPGSRILLLALNQK
jgi:hypothetical protein